MILLQQDAELSKTAMERETLVILTTFKRLSTTGFDRQGRDPQQRPAELPDRPCQAQRLWMRKRCGKPGKMGDFIFKPYEIVDLIMNMVNFVYVLWWMIR